MNLVPSQRKLPSHRKSIMSPNEAHVRTWGMRRSLMTKAFSDSLTISNNSNIVSPATCSSLSLSRNKSSSSETRASCRVRGSCRAASDSSPCHSDHLLRSGYTTSSLPNKTMIDGNDSICLLCPNPLHRRKRRKRLLRLPNTNSITKFQKIHFRVKL